MRLWLVVLAIAASGCGGSSSTPAATESTSGRPVRIDDPAAASTTESTAARPVRLAPTTPGEAAESDDLADPPPVEAPTGR